MLSQAVTRILTSLTQLEPVDDGMDALELAAAEASTDLEAAASVVSSDLQPSVDEVQSSFDELENDARGHLVREPPRSRSN